ncbi:MAG: hypothetical protein ABEJ89_04715 [Haloarculaceae archaeon]
MDTSERVAWGVVAVVVATAVVSGPLVGPIDLTTARDVPDYGNGSVAVTNVDLPGGARLSPGRYGAGELYVRVPAARLSYSEIRGHPLITYSVAIPGLNYSRTTTTFLSPDGAGTATLELDPASLDSGRVRADQYAATLTLTLRERGGDRVLAERTVTVEVDR